MIFTLNAPVRDRRRRGDEGKIIGFGAKHSKLVRVEWTNGTQSWVYENRLETKNQN